MAPCWYTARMMMMKNYRSLCLMTKLINTDCTEMGWENTEEEQLAALPPIQTNQQTNRMPSKPQKNTHEKDELIEVSISMATQNSFDDVPSQSAGRVWPNHGTDWCSVACY